MHKIIVERLDEMLRIAKLKKNDILCIAEDLDELFDKLEYCCDNDLIPKYKSEWLNEIRAKWKETFKDSDGF